MKVMKLASIEHVGIVVNDLPAAKAFFLNLGLDLQGEDRSKGPTQAKKTVI